MPPFHVKRLSSFAGAGAWATGAHEDRSAPATENRSTLGEPPPSSRHLLRPLPGGSVTPNSRDATPAHPREEGPAPSAMDRRGLDCDSRATTRTRAMPTRRPTLRRTVDAPFAADASTTPEVVAARPSRLTGFSLGRPTTSSGLASRETRPPTCNAGPTCRRHRRNRSAVSGLGPACHRAARHHPAPTPVPSHTDFAPSSPRGATATTRPTPWRHAWREVSRRRSSTIPASCTPHPRGICPAAGPRPAR